MTTVRFEPLLSRWRRRVEAALEQALPPATIHPATLHEAMRYAALGGGKRLRPILVYAAGGVLGADEALLDAPAAAVELIHAYSLVHDDLPAMDDDDLRRGRPTCHKVYGEAMALLAGDALQTRAFEVLATAPGLDGERRAALVAELARAAGSRGMAGGQAIDLAATGRTLGIAELEDMHIHKTGALIRACVRMAAVVAGDGPEAARLDHYAKCLGLAFQIRDDILDEEGEPEVMGKARGADRARGKPTYPALLGLEEARRTARALADEARQTLAPLGERAAVLAWLADHAVERLA
ncbi:(2E,6E)-farnesyl diphosphate synthase [Inmirania thermothiophila]|uniref:Farnesyl-diphosphate synthase n=1 Tax=Inmirania thermothiophila TaxID=1750597 RepID=A0A3N1XSV8_9GAMM|nr:farnesyl diphosphate synthase [Inmirania thermothiophila]ROR29725.1 farnesyl-diphosphate synthase [Inmirania thermothiophila]